MSEPAPPHADKAPGPPTPGLSFLLEDWAADDGTLDNDDDSWAADDGASDGRQSVHDSECDGFAVEPEIAEALRPVPPSTARTSPEATLPKGLSQQRRSPVSAGASEGPVEPGTAKAIEKVHPSPETKNPEAVVPQDPPEALRDVPSGIARKSQEAIVSEDLRQQRWPWECRDGSPVAAEAVEPGAPNPTERVPPGPETKNSDAVVPQGPLQKRPRTAEITLTKMTLAEFHEAFDENINSSKKKDSRRGHRRCGGRSIAQADRHFARCQVAQAGGSPGRDAHAAGLVQDEGPRSVDGGHFEQCCCEKWALRRTRRPLGTVLS